MHIRSSLPPPQVRMTWTCSLPLQFSTTVAAFVVDEAAVPSMLTWQLPSAADAAKQLLEHQQVRPRVLACCGIAKLPRVGCGMRCCKLEGQLLLGDACTRGSLECPLRHPQLQGCRHGSEAAERAAGGNHCALGNGPSFGCAPSPAVQERMIMLVPQQHAKSEGQVGDDTQGGRQHTAFGTTCRGCAHFACAAAHRSPAFALPRSLRAAAGRRRVCKPLRRSDVHIQPPAGVHRGV